jgi:hypothetical protein
LVEDDEDNILHGEKPHGTGGTRGVEDAMHGMLDMLPSTFAGVLVLVFGLGLPVIDVIGA